MERRKLGVYEGFRCQGKDGILMTKSRGVGKARGAAWLKGTVGKIICVECGCATARTGRRQKYCKPCAKKHWAAYVYNLRLNAGEFKNPGVGSGGAQPTGRDSPFWTNGTGGYRRYRKDACERCGSKKLLCLHHIDRNHMNNETNDNYETLCRSCHAKEHDAAAHFKTEASRQRSSRLIIALRLKMGRNVRSQT